MNNEEIKEILAELKDSVTFPIIDVPTIDGTDSELMDNCVLLKPNESKLLLDYITNLQEKYQNAINQSVVDHKYASQKEDEVITLQEENKQLNGKVKMLEHNCKQAEDSCRQHRLASKNHIRRLKRREEQRDKYKSRNEKALDKIQRIIDYGFDYDGFNNIKDLKGLIDMLVDYAVQSRNILQGDDKE